MNFNMPFKLFGHIMRQFRKTIFGRDTLNVIVLYRRPVLHFLLFYICGAKKYGAKTNHIFYVCIFSYLYLRIPIIRFSCA